MRFMMIMFPSGYENAKPGTVPDLKAMEVMRKYNEQLQKAGVLLALDGLTPPSMGARVTFKAGKSKVTDGPFPEAKEVVGGYWVIQVKSREAALEWASRIPGSDNEMVEVRRVIEITHHGKRGDSKTSPFTWKTIWPHWYLDWRMLVSQSCTQENDAAHTYHG